MDALVSALGGEGGRTLHFINLSSTILDCEIVEQGWGGPSTSYRIHTDTGSSTAQTSVVATHGGNPTMIARVDWSYTPYVEIREHLGRTPARDWLVLSGDRSARRVHVNRVRYDWAPLMNDLCLYVPDPISPRIIARCVKTRQSVTLHLSKEAVDLCLVETSIVAVVLMLSGKNID
ncbi:hypothetical protein PUNSTDRAFT_134876 [Punctularia strigosozonata HHB-11173 SS5]|uniref:uncharacterized protein n=1 Tax=Punctularia strigosozonata (strain HHB-11173) TaxID=741275 RepID=UPI0004416649|nr:uncharacterized protein PUNSTDRAFT_134876 [Punctularia strigosozonata HHB-11173 SS5]EIN08497.1 hypothetical protein PUNSTDRAFT_134876 [Punctularia strigosozonata HHB-11173 SS5]